MKSINFYLLCKVHNLNCEVCIIFTIHLHLFTYLMNSSSSSSRGVLAGVVIVTCYQIIFKQRYFMHSDKSG